MNLPISSKLFNFFGIQLFIDLFYNLFYFFKIGNNVYTFILEFSNLINDLIFIAL